MKYFQSLLIYTSFHQELLFHTQSLNVIYWFNTLFDGFVLAMEEKMCVCVWVGTINCIASWSVQIFGRGVHEVCKTINIPEHNNLPQMTWQN